MGFVAIARVTEDKWITCTTKDNISFGLEPGDELRIDTTICREVRLDNQAVFIDHVKEDPNYFEHPVPQLYGFQSYVSVPIIKKDGSFFGTLCAIDPKPAKVKNDKIRGMFNLFADLISFHLQALEDIDATNASLEAALFNSKLRDQFIAVLGHDLNNPIATTRMSAEILLQTSKDEKVQRQASNIKSTSYRMEGLIENVLDFARGRLGEEMVLQKKRQSLKAVVDQIVKEIRIVSPHRTIELTYELQEEVNCDARRLSQLFSILLGNADTHGSYDDPIKVKATQVGKKFHFIVSNGGNRIPDAIRPHLFKAFYKNELKPGKQGLGLGLFIATEISKAHKGSITFKSTNKETSFTYKMPL